MTLRTQQHPFWGIKRKEGERRNEGKIMGGEKRKEKEEEERRERDGLVCDFIIR